MDIRVDRPPLSPARRFACVHVIAVPVAFASAALAARHAGLDQRVAELLFDAAANTFPARRWLALELLGHKLAQSALWALWLTLVAAALAARSVARLRPYRALLWTTAAAMAAGPLLVVLLKELNAYPCPWSLKRFGGLADDSDAWFVPAAQVGRCFPSGHAAGGFSLVALAFAADVAGAARLRRAFFALALSAGAVFAGVRIAQGAHFVSHNLWSAALVWCCAALVFLPFYQRPVAV